MEKPDYSTTDPMFLRNYGFWNQDEQAALSRAKVAIAGVGGDGFELGYNLAQMGVKHFSIADPEVFERENSNRVPGATMSAIGRPKTEVFIERVTDLQPEASIDVYDTGVSSENVTDFMQDADLVLDESELTTPGIGVLIAREARQKKIPSLMVMNVGFAAIATSFHPESRWTFERMMGIAESAPIDEVQDMRIDLSRCLPYIPPYADYSVLKSVVNGASLPSIKQGVSTAAAIGGSEAFLHLTRDANNRRRQPTWQPKFRYMDSYTNKSGIRRNPKFWYMVGGAVMSARTKFGHNPSCEYPLRDRE